MIKLKDIIKEIENENENIILYHGTFGQLIPSIKQHGIVPGGKTVRNYDWSDKKFVYLSNDPDYAKSFVETSENDDIPEDWHDNIVVIAVNVSKLDDVNLIKDSNIKFGHEGSLYGAKSYMYFGIIPPDAIISYDADELNDEPNEPLNEALYDVQIWYHGSSSGDLRGGVTGLHLGTYKAAEQALEARIGVPVEGTWDGTREYGKTLLCGKKTLKKRHKVTGFNCDITRNGPEEDFYPTGSPKYSPYFLLTMKPAIKKYKVLCPIINSRGRPYTDNYANHLMARLIKQGKANVGAYYTNISEDEGSVSVVVPNGNFVKEV